MFDNTQTLNTKDLADSIRMLSGVLLTEKQLLKKQVADNKGKIHLICPGMITRVEPTMMHGREGWYGTRVFYVNGDIFKIDITTEALAQILGITAGEDL